MLLERVMLTDWSAPKLTWGIVRRLVSTESIGSPALVVIAICIELEGKRAVDGFLNPDTAIVDL